MRISDWSSDVCSSDLHPPYPACKKARIGPRADECRDPRDRHQRHERRGSRGAAGADAPRDRQSRRRNAQAGGAFGRQGLTAEQVWPEKFEMPDAERITIIHGRTPESAAMVANTKRAMAITARIKRLTFNDADEVRPIYRAQPGRAPGGERGVQ